MELATTPGDCGDAPCAASSMPFFTTLNSVQLDTRFADTTLPIRIQTGDVYFSPGNMAKNEAADPGTMVNFPEFLLAIGAWVGGRPEFPDGRYWASDTV